MKKIGIILIISLSYVLPSRAQLDVSLFFDKRTIRLLDVDDHLDPVITWNMKGEVQAEFNDGLNSVRDGNWNKALLNFQEVIKLDESFAPAYYYSGVCQKKMRHFSEAAKDFQAAIREDKTLSESYIELAELYQLKGSFDKAVSQYKKSLTARQDFVRGYYGLGLVAQDKHEIVEARRQYQKCREVDPKFAPAYVADALVAYQQSGPSTELLSQLDKAIAADSTYGQSYFWRGLFLLSFKESSKALPDWNKAIQLYPSNWFMLIMRGYLYVELKKFDEAFADFRKVIVSREVSEDRFIGGQTMLDKQIDIQTAASYMISHGYGLEEEAFYNLKKGFCLLLAGKKEALESLSVSAKMEPSACAYYLMAVTLEHGKAHMVAMEYYTKALELDNDIFDAHKKRAIYKYELRKWDEMEQDFKEMERLQPGSPVIYRLRGLARSQKGDFYGATEDLTNYLKTDSSDLSIIETLALCRHHAQDYRGSNDLINLMLKSKPDDVWLKDLSAKNFLGAHDTLTAISIYKGLITMPNASSFRGEPSFRFALARIFIAQKNWKEATKVLKSIPPLGSIIDNQISAEAECLRGIIEYEQGNFKESLPHLNQGIRVLSNNHEAKYYRAMANYKLGLTVSALDELKLLSKVPYPDAEKALKQLEK